jgi:lipopolysaccharide/colanic/teichoic acid biosynthesis glycosyltransferase
MLSAERRESWVVQGDGAAAKVLRRGRSLVVGAEALHDPTTTDELARLALAGARVLRIRDHYEQTMRRALLDDLDESWFLFDRPLRRRPVYTAVKTVVDLAAGVIGSLIALLVVPLVWLVYRLDDRGPVFYVQERIGLHGRPFRMWKFRTMQVDAEAEGPVWAQADDDRVTRLGRLLRSTHLDELPQFFNVLRREMSLIGPRPERPVFVRLLGRAIPFFDRRHLVRPGVTGWAVVRFGYSGSVRDKWIIHEHDLYYLKHRSLLLDLEIMARTVLVMLTRRGR